MKILRPNWHHFDHKFVNRKFTGGLTYLGDNCIMGEYYPWAIYKVDKPDRSKGHKNFMLLKMDESGRGIVSGLTKKQMESARYVVGLLCLKCETAIYSAMRHHCQDCLCELADDRCYVDGGREYTRIGFGKGSRTVPIRIDLVKGTIKFRKKDHPKYKGAKK